MVAFRLLVFFITLLFPSWVCAQFRGRVVNADTREGLAFATLHFPDQKNTIQTNENGFFECNIDNTPRQKVIVHLVGYQRKTTWLDSVISLEPLDALLDEVEVKAQSIVAAQGQTAVRLSDQELLKNAGNTLGETLKSITGVSTLQTGNSIAKPVIHGLHSNRILILNHGVRQEGQQWGSEHAPEVDAFVASQMTVIKGAAGVRYGADAMAGVIILSPNVLPYQQKNITGELNAAAASNGRAGTVSGIVQGATKQWAWRLQSTLKRSGNIQTPHYFLKNTGLAEWNMSVNVGYKHKRVQAELFLSRFSTRLGIFQGAHIGNLTDLRNVLANGKPFVTGDFSYIIDRPFQAIQHYLLKSSVDYDLEKHGKLSVVYAFQLNSRKEYDSHRLRNDTTNRPELNFELQTHTLEAVWQRKKNRSVGVALMTQGNVFEGRPLIPNFRSHNAGVFWIEKRTQPRSSIEWGLRYDYKWLRTFRRERNGDISSVMFNFHNVSGSVGFEYDVSRFLTWKINAATAWRPPTVNELFSDGVHHGSASYEKGNPDLLPEIALNTHTSMNYEREKVNVEITAYQNYIRNFIYLQPQFPEVLTIRGAFPSFAYTQTNAVLRGIDAKINWKITSKFNTTPKISLLWATNLETKQGLVWMPPQRVEQEFRYDFSSKLYAALQYNFVARQHRVPPDSDYAEPPPAYWLWNVECGGSFGNIRWVLTANNVLNVAYRDYMNRFRYFSDEIGRNVAVKVRYQF